MRGTALNISSFAYSNLFSNEYATSEKWCVTSLPELTGQTLKAIIFVDTIIIFDLSYYTNIMCRHRVQLVRRVAQEPLVRGSNPSGARVQWNEGCAEPLGGGSNPYEME